MTAAVTDINWGLLEGIDTKTSTFPARARLNGEWILVFQTNTGFRGTQRACPHMGATLQDASLIGGGTMIRCAQHVFTYKMSDGKGVNCPGFRIKVFEIKEEGGQLFGRAVASSQESK
jgi:nitrite reductase/ring-hydroxylating ferredoxin subunit